MKSIDIVRDSNSSKNKAITLIALVITIIVLLILAGVTVATITGENGLLSKAATARQRTEEAEQDEKYKLNSYENEINNYSALGRTGEGSVSAEYVELESTFSSNVATFNYPDGYNMNNTYIISAKAYRSDDKIWTNRRNDNTLTNNTDTIELLDSTIKWSFIVNTVPYTTAKILIVKIN